jgi:3-methylcrotonyl-CoA carboxylase beta subunit
MTSPTPSASTATATNALRTLSSEYLASEAKLRLGGGQSAIDRQHEKGRLTARERIARLVDPVSSKAGETTAPPDAAQFTELGLWAAHAMYKEYGGAPGAGVVTGVGMIHGNPWMIIANDATVKAGAFFPMTCKKIIRAQTMAMMARLPLVYLVDSAGVFLPLQEDVFPDTDDFGRIFRNNAVLSAEGIPQIAAIMGYCVAGGGYLPVLCDTLLMTEGSGLYLAGPALVKAAIGQVVTDEELGGAKMHAGISGTIDFREKDDESCLRRLREVADKYHPYANSPSGLDPHQLWTDAERDLVRDKMQHFMEKAKLNAPAAESLGDLLEEIPPLGSSDDVYGVFQDKAGSQYDVRGIITCIVDARGVPNRDGHTSLESNFDEYKSEYGPSLVCGYAKIGGQAVGIVANQKKLTKTGSGAVQLPAVIYYEAADKAARFIMDCNQRKIPLVFLHDTTGFMVGKESEQHGIIRAGAKMVNAMSNCVVPKIVVILGGSYGAGNYAMCGRAFDPFISLAWPSAKCAVMGANQATGVLTTIEEASRKRKGESIDEDTHKQIYSAIHASYTEQADIRHGAARGWVDRIIEPHKTREEIIAALTMTRGWDYSKAFKTGVLQT